MFLSKISVHSCLITHYIVKEKVFAVIVLQAFSTEEIIECHIKYYFKSNAKQRIGMPKKEEYVKFKNFERKIKSLLLIYGEFESILVPEDNGK